jgi:hypothetical protein
MRVSDVSEKLLLTCGAELGVDTLNQLRTIPQKPVKGAGNPTHSGDNLVVIGQ